MWLFERQQMRDIAVRIDLLKLTPGGENAPRERALTRIATRREAQTLNRVLERMVVLVHRFMANV